MTLDLVIKGGRIFTGEPGSPFVDAVGITGDRISALGSEEVRRLGQEAVIIDLEGGLATPGFIDSHVHPVTSGLDRLRCSIDEGDDARSAVMKIASYAENYPDAEWILGAGWLSSWFDGGCPGKDLIDAVVSDRPVLVENADGHGAWANSRALEIAGINDRTLDPTDGRIERLPDGTPQGTLHEGAVAMVARFAPPTTHEELIAGLVEGQSNLLSHGVTGWQDASVTPEVEAAYIELAARGLLVGRVVGALWWDRHRGHEQIDELVARRERSRPGLQFTSVKLMLDGVMENFTASMLDPYLDSNGMATDNHGIDFIDPNELAEIVTRLDRDGFQCHFHAIGDAAVRNALDAVEAAQTTNQTGDRRHHIAHIQVVDPADISRFADLGVVANAQPYWACNDDYQVELTRPFIGEDRYPRQYPFASLWRSGARLAMGSDWGVSTANVMREIDVAISRTCGDTPPLVAEEALPPNVALSAFTAGSAFVNHAEGVVGTVARGKLADLAVLDRDPLIDGSFDETRVRYTIVGGEIAFEED